jgi:hypothetical protein
MERPARLRTANALLDSERVPANNRVILGRDVQRRCSTTTIERAAAETILRDAIASGEANDGAGP